MRKLGSYWRMITFTCLLYDLIPYYDEGTLSRSSLTAGQQQPLDDILSRYLSFMDTIYSLDLQEAHAVSSLIPGDALAKLLGNIPPRQITEAKELATTHQIIYNITTRSEMEKAIKSGKFKYP
jgi:hypothetical protein